MCCVIQYRCYNRRKVRGDFMASKSANVNVRVEPDIKAKAESILESLGVSASAFINMTYRQVIFKKGIPFPVELPSGIETRDNMTKQEFDEMMRKGLEQAKAGEAVPYQSAFEKIMQGL